VNSIVHALPVLHAGHPIWYRGRLAAVACDEEVYSVGWLEQRDRPVVRAMALAVFEAPHLTADQQFSFAAYYLLPEERWDDLRAASDETIACLTGLPVDLVQRRRVLPSVRTSFATPEPAAICA
jgi:hypothetical protein